MRMDRLNSWMEGRQDNLAPVMQLAVSGSHALRVYRRTPYGQCVRYLTVILKQLT